MTESLTLDVDQARVAHASASERLLVEAGPGSGKTETVGARVEYLVEEEGLDPGNVLVLSFSRAAVEAVQRRQRNRANHITGWVTTLDSLATRLLFDAAVNPEPIPFDKRIERLLRLIESGDMCAPLAYIEHVIIDEAQDIVGPRADLVAALLSTLPNDVGFTILGDELQGIYDFQLPVGTLVERTLFDAGLALGSTAVRLNGQYRASTRGAKRAMTLRDTVDEPTQWRAAMLSWLADAPPVRDFNEFTEILAKESGTVAVLTDTNAAALGVLKELNHAGIRAEFLPRSMDRALAPWISDVLGDAPGSISRDHFLARATELPIEAEEAWVLMRRLTAARGLSLDVRELTHRLASGMAPFALGSPRPNVVVSTVHRAKGLEFDNVYLLHPDDWVHSDDWGPDQARALARRMYVAITRPRRNLFTFRLSAGLKRWKKDRTSDRAIRFKNYGTTGFEVRGIDWRWSVPPSHQVDPARTQELLRTLTGATPLPVEVELSEQRSTAANPVYNASLDDTPIGTLNAEFINVFRRRAAGKNGWPRKLLDLHLIGVETVAGQPQPGPVGQNGLWLSPQIVGPATLIWSKDE